MAFGEDEHRPYNTLHSEHHPDQAIDRKRLKKTFISYTGDEHGIENTNESINGYSGRLLPHKISIQRKVIITFYCICIWQIDTRPVAVTC